MRERKKLAVEVKEGKLGERTEGRGVKRSKGDMGRPREPPWWASLEQDSGE